MSYIDEKLLADLEDESVRTLVEREVAQLTPYQRVVVHMALQREHRMTRLSLLIGTAMGFGLGLLIGGGL